MVPFFAIASLGIDIWKAYDAHKKVVNLDEIKNGINEISNKIDEVNKGIESILSDTSLIIDITLSQPITELKGKLIAAQLHFHDFDSFNGDDKEKRTYLTTQVIGECQDVQGGLISLINDYIDNKRPLGYSCVAYCLFSVTMSFMFMVMKLYDKLYGGIYYTPAKREADIESLYNVSFKVGDPVVIQIENHHTPVVTTDTEDYHRGTQGSSAVPDHIIESSFHHYMEENCDWNYNVPSDQYTLVSSKITVRPQRVPRDRQHPWQISQAEINTAKSVTYNSISAKRTNFMNSDIDSDPIYLLVCANLDVSITTYRAVDAWKKKYLIVLNATNKLYKKWGVQRLTLKKIPRF
jgi:hypothetical protein